MSRRSAFRERQSLDECCKLCALTPTRTHARAQLFILSAGTGINAGMMAWGDSMLKYTGKPRADMYRDLTHSTIGMWADRC